MITTTCCFPKTISLPARSAQRPIELKQRLGRALFRRRRPSSQISNEGRSLFKFLTGRGRIGRRFAMRLLGNRKHPGPRPRADDCRSARNGMWPSAFLSSIRHVTNMPAIEYRLQRRGHRPARPGRHPVERLKNAHRHRRALMRMLFDYYETDNLIICLSTRRNLDLMQDFCGDRSIDPPARGAMRLYRRRI